MSESGGQKFLSNPRTIPLVWRGWGSAYLCWLGSSVVSDTDLAQIWGLELLALMPVPQVGLLL